jgi:hypothetical protein
VIGNSQLDGVECESKALPNFALRRIKRTPTLDSLATSGRRGGAVIEIHVSKNGAGAA